MKTTQADAPDNRRPCSVPSSSWSGPSSSIRRNGSTVADLDRSRGQSASRGGRGSAAGIRAAAREARPRRISSAGTDRYVSTTGSDTGDCSSPGSPCLTITYAISQSVAGDAIHVAAGTYAVANANINKSLTFLGEQAGVDARDGRPAASESIIAGSGFGTFHLSAADITFDGFKFANLQGRELD